MANCHRSVPLIAAASALFFLPCLAAIAALLFGSRSAVLPFSRTEPSLLRNHLGMPRQQQIEDALYLTSPGAALLLGRRPYQEDRLLCSPNIRLAGPVSGDRGIDAGLYGVFDGHLGDAASDFAAKSLADRFLHHVSSSFSTSAASVNGSYSVEEFSWLEAALLAALYDIDTAFGKLAASHSIKSGSTACVALQVRKQILVANVGDSKGFLCSACNGMKQKTEEQHQGGALESYRKSRRRRVSRMSKEAALSVHSEGLCVQKLSSDHRPDRPDEKLRIEASGGFVTNGSLPRVNGELAVSRSIGDVELQKYGVISEPELSGWQRVTDDDKFLVVASDGVFEKLSPQEVCNVLHALGSGQDLTSIMEWLEKDNSAVIALPGVSTSQASSKKDDNISGSNPHVSASSSAHIATIHGCEGGTSVQTTTPFRQCASGVAYIMAQILVEIAYRAGSLDNLSAIVVPLKAAMG